MDIEAGSIVAGKVTGITKFGAFVTVAPGKSGLVHISEISGSFVSDVREHLSEGQSVTVKVIGFDASGRMNLSIKAALAPSPRMASPRTAPSRTSTPHERRPAPGAPVGEATFEDKLKRFMQDSDNKMSGIQQYSSQKGSRKRK